MTVQGAGTPANRPVGRRRSADRRAAPCRQRARRPHPFGQSTSARRSPAANVTNTRNELRVRSVQLDLCRIDSDEGTFTLNGQPLARSSTSPLIRILSPANIGARSPDGLLGLGLRCAHGRLAVGSARKKAFASGVPGRQRVREPRANL